MGGESPKGVKNHGNFQSVKTEDTSPFVSEEMMGKSIWKILPELGFSVYGIDESELEMNHAINDQVQYFI